MAYRERVAWLTLLAMTTTFVPFFAAIRLGIYDLGDLPNLRLLGAFAAVTVVQLVILGIGHAVLRARFPEDAQAPADERDRAIERVSTRWAYHVLIAGVILVGVVMPFSSRGWEIVSAALAAILLAEVVHYGGVIVGYRRQR